MEIKKIYISAFGSLKDYSLEFSDGFQVIYGQNEAGKTTITEFLKAMFYGTGKRSAGKTMSIREKYLPFDDSAPAGRVFFKHSGTNYCLERQFRKSDSTDKVTLTNIDTGKSEACEPDIGTRLFGISSSAFERSVFVGNTPEFQKDETAQGEINRKLSNIALTGEDDVSYTQVDKRLETAKNKLISKSGKAGSCIDDINECESLKEQLAFADGAAKKKQRLLSDISAVSSKIKDLSERYKEQKQVLDRAKDIENASKTREYLELKAKLDSVTESLVIDGNTVADEMFIKKIEFGFSKLDNMAEKISDLKAEQDRLLKASENRQEFSAEAIKEQIEKAKTELAEIVSRKESLTEQEHNTKEQIKKAEAEASADNKKSVNILLLIFGILGVLSGVAVYFALKSIIISGAVFGVGILLLILAFIIGAGAGKKAQSRLAELNALLDRINAEKLLVGDRENNAKSKIENLNTALDFGIDEQERTKEISSRLNEAQGLYRDERKRVLKFFGLSEDTDIKALKEKAQSLSEKAQEQKQIKLRLSYLSRDLGGISYEEAREKLENCGEEMPDLSQAKRIAEELSDEISRAENIKTALETELKTGFRGVPDPEDLRRKIEEKEEIIAVKKDFCEVAEIAREVLEESFIDARKSFGGVLKEKTLENFKALTLGAYNDVTVSTDFDISAEKNGIFGSYQAEYLSRGTKDQAYLALRLAIAKLIADKESLPLILDDALSQYDDNRFKSAMQFLKDYANGGQAMLFTCHKFVCEEAENNGIPVIKL